MCNFFWNFYSLFFLVSLIFYKIKHWLQRLLFVDYRRLELSVINWFIQCCGNSPFVQNCLNRKGWNFIKYTHTHSLVSLCACIFAWRNNFELKHLMKYNFAKSFLFFYAYAPNGLNVEQVGTYIHICKRVCVYVCMHRWAKAFCVLLCFSRPHGLKDNDGKA